MCRHSYDYQGHRSYGDTIPGFAQGAHFPGDEPGRRCRLSGGVCGNPGGDTPMGCASNTSTEWLCPDCQWEEIDAVLWKYGDACRKNDKAGTFFCRACEGEWTDAELARAFTGLLVLLNQEQKKAEQARIDAEAGRELLQSVLDCVREAIGVAV